MEHRKPEKARTRKALKNTSLEKHKAWGPLGALLGRLGDFWGRLEGLLDCLGVLLGCLRALSDETAVQVSSRRRGPSLPEGGHNPRDTPPPGGEGIKGKGLPFDVITTLRDPPYLFDLPYDDDDDSKGAGVLQFGLGWPRVEGPLSHTDWVADLVRAYSRGV